MTAAPSNFASTQILWLVLPIRHECDISERLFPALYELVASFAGKAPVRACAWVVLVGA